MRHKALLPQAWAMRLSHGIALLGTLQLMLACSVDELRNAQRKDCQDCERQGGRCITDEYCLLPTKDAAVGGNSDASASTPDAGPAVYARCTEEGQSELCYEAQDQRTSLQPPCRAGTRTCTDGHWTQCEHQVLPAAEDCNGEDDDCDGRIDEQLATSECSVAGGKGACTLGAKLCISGRYTCVQVAHPQTDVCNGEDDDCDGATDEDTALSCYPAASGCEMSGDGQYACRGSCLPGRRSCIDGQYAEACEAAVTPESSERCTSSGMSALDEDCDGEIDEGCACNDGVSCYTGSPHASQEQLPCHAGTRMCSDATHGTCVDEVIPEAESCANEGRDDDCDGVPDNVPLRDTSCEEQSSAVGACKSGALWQCRDGQQECVDAMPATEICDGRGIDEDCDGAVDEGFDLDSDEDNCGSCGAQCAAGLSCCGGTCVNTDTSNAHCSRCGRSCGSGESCCSASCVDTKSDGKNCGTCGNTCGLLGCSAGKCNLL